MPACSVTRWNVNYSLHVSKQAAPEVYTIRELDLIWKYLVNDVLELYDVQLGGVDDNKDTGCAVMHVMPRFTAPCPDSNGVRVLPASALMEYLLVQHNRSGVAQAITKVAHDQTRLQTVVAKLRGQLLMHPHKLPRTVRCDDIQLQADGSKLMLHSGIRPNNMTFTAKPEYQRVWKEYVRLKHAVAGKNRMSLNESRQMSKIKAQLATFKRNSNLQRDVTVRVPVQGFVRTGLYSDIVQNLVMLLPVLNQVRYHWSLLYFEQNCLQYTFKNRALLELVFTHPSYRAGHGVNADHVRNVLSNTGLRHPVHANPMHTRYNNRKRGINSLLDIMSRQGSKHVKVSQVANNERLEYLGDAVIEFCTTVHLFYMFPDLDEGGLATFRSALVQNTHLGQVAKRCGLGDWLLYAHGPDLCHQADFNHALANSFEALLGAILLDAGLKEADRFLAGAFFPETSDNQKHYVWTHLPKHYLQDCEPLGDRHWVARAPALQQLQLFEHSTGIHYTHIRLLAKALTNRNVPFNFLTYGHNQRLELLGDSVLQLVTSEYLYKHFPQHHEGHLSLLRSSLVNNKTQSVVCDDLGLANYQIRSQKQVSKLTAGNAQVPSTASAQTQERGQQDCSTAMQSTGTAHVSPLGLPPTPMRVKDKADLVEAVLGSLYVDAGLEPCKVFCKVCFFPRLKYFIVSQRWNDAKSQLQQSCLTLRKLDGGEPEIPHYRVISARGPTNTRLFSVAVYFRSIRLATGTASSVQAAEMRAAELALAKYAHKFPQINRNRKKKKNTVTGYGNKRYMGNRNAFNPTNQHHPFHTHARARPFGYGNHPAKNRPLTQARGIIGKYSQWRAQRTGPSTAFGSPNVSRPSDRFAAPYQRFAHRKQRP